MNFHKWVTVHLNRTRRLRFNLWNSNLQASYHVNFKSKLVHSLSGNGVFQSTSRTKCRIKTMWNPTKVGWRCKEHLSTIKVSGWRHLIKINSLNKTAPKTHRYYRFVKLREMLHKKEELRFRRFCTSQLILKTFVESQSPRCKWGSKVLLWSKWTNWDRSQPRCRGFNKFENFLAIKST